MGKNDVVKFLLVNSGIGNSLFGRQKAEIGCVQIGVGVPSFLYSGYRLELFDDNSVLLVKGLAIAFEKSMLQKIFIFRNN